MSEEISKDKWQEIEEYLRDRLFPQVAFRVGDHEVSVQKHFIAENRMALLVYIDGWIKGEWVGRETEGIPPIVKQVWRKSSRSLYKPAERRRMEKGIGKRKAKEWFPNIDKVLVSYVPDFLKAKTLVNQFRRIPVIELVKMGNS